MSSLNKTFLFVFLVFAFVFNIQFVLAADGSGTCTLSPSQVTENTIETLTFTFTASETMDGGSITITVPGGWSVPQGTSGIEGYTVASSTGTIGTITFSGQTLTVPITTLASSETITVVYGSGGDLSKAKVQDVTGRGGSVLFAVSSKSSAGGTLTDIASSPTISLVARSIPDGTAPISVLTDPIEGQIIKTSNYTLWGTAIDSGGSTPAWVKVGIKPENGEIVWHEAQVVGQSFSTWKYEWQNIVEGTYTLQTKSADWIGNNETPAEGIIVTVDFSVTEAVSEPFDSAQGEQAEKPIAEMTVAELEAKITEIRLKIIELLTQLIQIIQEQLKAL